MKLHFIKCTVNMRKWTQNDQHTKRNSYKITELQRKRKKKF